METRTNRQRTERGHRSSRGRGTRRPDKAIYVPRALRRNVCDSGSDEHSRSSSSYCFSASEESSSETVDPQPANQEPGIYRAIPESSLDTAESLRANQEPGDYSVPMKSSSDTADPHLAKQEPSDTAGSLLANQEPEFFSAREPDLFMQLSGSGRDPWPPAWDQTISYFMAMNLEDQTEEDDTGFTPSETQRKEETYDFYSEIVAQLKEGEVVVENVQSDFSGFENVWINHEEFAHVIEIYDFPAIFKTDDLLDAFADYSEGGMKIKWVDNTHALGVFSSASAARQALSIRHPLLKTRTLSEGSKKAKGKAMRRAEFIQPVKARPRTDTVVARRMVTRALGLRGGSRGKRY